MNKKKRKTFFEEINQFLKIKSIKIAIYWHHFYQTFSSNQPSISEGNNINNMVEHYWLN